MNHQSPAPEIYRELSRPYPTNAEMEKNLDEFHVGCAALRLKHRIPDVVVLLQCNAITNPEATAPDQLVSEQAREGWYFNRFSFGDPMKALALLAQGYGSERALFEKRMAEVLKGAR